MLISFYKYQGAGNDFILFDNRDGALQPTESAVSFLCNRHFGIGADGLMLLEAPRAEGDDFYMVYYNSDGRESTMCGNGGRCIARFAVDLGLADHRVQFSAIDGPHWAEVEEQKVRLGMIDAAAVEERNGGFFVNTGSPHHVEHRHGGPSFELDARALRDAYGNEGANVNFVEACAGELSIRTYERGVEGETLACGTGAVAGALVAVQQGWVEASPVTLYARGGTLEVSFDGQGPFTNVVLTGPAVKVFEGKIQWPHD